MRDLTKDQSLEEWREEVKDVVLPTWAVTAMPEHLPLTVISYWGDRFLVSHDSNEFLTVIDAYTHAREVDTRYQVVFDESINGQGGELLGGSFFCDREPNAYSSQIFFATRTENSEAELKYAYKHFVENTVEDYLAEPTDFSNAETFIENHPVFWKQHDGDLFRWHANEGMKSIRHSRGTDRESGLRWVALEPWVRQPSPYSGFIAPCRLRVEANSHKAAIIELAALIHKFYRIDGTEIPWKRDDNEV